MFMLDKAGRGLVELGPQDFFTEAEFQSLLADYPALLVGAQIRPGDPRKWLLVRREARLADSADGSGRWPIDHLFLDQDATPTFVEVKRHTDSRIRREVVGQMLDYAANAVAYLNAEQMRSWVDAQAEAQGTDGDSLIQSTFGDDLDPDAYWLAVKTNLQAGRIRMLFVADSIPPELRRIVEFLNEQMDPAEVLALELAQFGAGDVRTLVPRVIGLSQKAQAMKSASRGARGEWDADAAIRELAAVDPQLGAVGQRLADWGRATPGVRLGVAHRLPEVILEAEYGDETVFVVSLTTERRLYVGFAAWKSGIFTDPLLRQRFAADVAAALGSGPIQTRGWKWVDAGLLFDPAAVERLLVVIGNLIDVVGQAARPGPAPSE